MKKIGARALTCTATALCLLAIGPACTSSAQVPQTPPGNAVVLAAIFPHDVTVSQAPSSGGKPSTPETIRLTLTNNSAASVTLKKANACMTHVWTVGDSTGQVIDGLEMCPMIFMPVTQTIAPHGTFTATQDLPLDGSKYRDGAQYTLRYSFWGVTANVSFTAHVAQ